MISPTQLGMVRAAHRGGAGAVGAGRRAAGVAAALRGRHGRVRRRAHCIHRRLPLPPSSAAPCGGVLRGHSAVPAGAGAAGAAGVAGAAVRGAAGRRGVARRGARGARGGRRAAVPRLRRPARLQPVRGTRAPQAGACNVHILPGPAGHRA